MKIDIDAETAGNILCVVLKQQYLDLSPKLGGVPMFSIDKKENKIQYEAFKKAFELVMDYNGVVYEK